MGAPTVAIATCQWHSELEPETAQLLAALRGRGLAAAAVPWNAPADWAGYDAVIVRQTWDYTWLLADFLRWTRVIGDRLHNAPDVIAWNADKRYLFDLERAGLPPSDEPHGAEDMSLRDAEPDVVALALRAWEFAAARFGAPLYARVDILRSNAGEPAVLELELIEPALFLDFAPGSAEALAEAVLRRACGAA